MSRISQALALLFGRDASVQKADRPTLLGVGTVWDVGEWLGIGATSEGGSISNVGGFQQDLHGRFDTIASSQTVFACATLVANDIGKMRPRLMTQTAFRTWAETEHKAISPVLEMPNHYQNWIQFLQTWQLSIGLRGNFYALKERDGRGVVTALYPLHPDRCRPLISVSGEVFYQLSPDYLNQVGVETVIVPATEIIHDRVNALHHPLIGLSPIYACALPAIQAIAIQRNATTFFRNMSQPSGVLSSEQRITDAEAQDYGSRWKANYSGKNTGKVAVLGNGLKYESVGVSATDSQLIEQLEMTGRAVCSCYHVPPYMVGVGDMPPYNNIEALSQQYYGQCLQSLIGQVELSLGSALELRALPGRYRITLDVNALLRMDTATRYKAHSDSITGGWKAPNEVRAEEDLDPVAGGESPLMQVQNFSLAALAARDALGPAPSTIGGPGTAPAASAGGKSIGAPGEATESRVIAELAGDLRSEIRDARRIADLARILATDPSLKSRLDAINERVDMHKGLLDGAWLEMREALMARNLARWRGL